MSNWPATIFRHWFVAARSQAVRNRPISVAFLGTPMVIARLKDGVLIAAEDRCPHRHAPLSAGHITRDGLQCPYHGWTFGNGGVCTKMPGVSGTAAHTPRVPNYTAIEHDGLVWVNLDSHADPSRIPTLVTNAKPQQRRFLWQTLWQAPIVDCLENFLDAMHTHYVHAGLVRHTAQRRAVSAVLNVTNDGFSIDYRGQSLQSGLLYRLFESPRLSERAIFSAPAVAQIEYRYKNGSVIQITLYFTPHDTHSTHVFATLHLSGRWAPSWLVRMLVWPFLRKVAQQDGHMLQLQTTNRRRFTPQRFVSSPSDLVRPYLERIWSDSIDGPSLPETRTVELLI